MSLHDVVDIVFPVLRRATTDGQLARAQQADLALIAATDWSKCPDVGLEEARRLADAEAERRSVADGRATTYLAAVAALVPIALTIEAAVWEKKTGNAPLWIDALLLLAAAIYTGMAGWWAFSTLQVAGAHRPDIHDLTRAWSAPDPRARMIEATLTAARLNWQGTNRKVSCIKMTHAFLARAFITFILLLVFNAGWVIVEQLPLGHGTSIPRAHEASAPAATRPVRQAEKHPTTANPAMAPAERSTLNGPCTRVNHGKP